MTHSRVFAAAAAVVPVALAVLVVPTAGAAAHRSAADPAFGIDVQGLKGSGCRKQDTAVVLSNGNLALTISYSAFTATLTGTAKDAARDCRIRLKLRAPKGHRYLVTGVVQRGFADLGEGATGRFAGDYNYPGRAPLYQATRTFAAGTSDAWQDDATATAEWSPCDQHKPFEINAAVHVSGKGAAAAESSLSIDSTDANASTVLRLRWEKC
ncbi:MAG TPA: DUF4360 domain-containing protein [Pilimelia sp.]|nr:DUF4360 domain-containing protein [Pilimelia sp.]